MTNKNISFREQYERLNNLSNEKKKIYIYIYI
jgi:hypothetical protein